MHPDGYPLVGHEVIVQRTALMCLNFLPGGPIPLAQVSPFILHLLYHATIILLNMTQLSRNEDEIENLNILKETLKFLRGR